MKCLNSTNNILIFFLILLFITLCSVFLFVPNTFTKSDENAQIAKIELKNFSMYQISESFVEMKIEGERALEFSDYEVIYDFLVSRYRIGDTKKNFEYISGTKVVKKGNNFDFPSGAIYTKSDGENFWSEAGSYSYATRVFKGKGDFSFNSSIGEFRGKDIIYDQKSRNIQAKNIISKIYLESKENKEKDFTQRTQEKYRGEK